MASTSDWQGAREKCIVRADEEEKKIELVGAAASGGYRERPSGEWMIVVADPIIIWIDYRFVPVRRLQEGDLVTLEIDSMISRMIFAPGTKIIWSTSRKRREYRNRMNEYCSW